LLLYIISMLSVLKLRKSHPDLERPFSVPFYPLTPIIALVIASVALIALIVYNFILSLIFAGILLFSFAYFIFKYKSKAS